MWEIFSNSEAADATGAEKAVFEGVAAAAVAVEE